MADSCLGIYICHGMGVLSIKVFFFFGVIVVILISFIAIGIPSVALSGFGCFVPLYFCSIADLRIECEY